MRIIKTIMQAVQRLLASRWLWPVCFAGAAAIHLGTAALRLDTFFPYPEAVDFAAYYAGAWSLRLGLSPYPWSEGLLAFLAETRQLSVYWALGDRLGTAWGADPCPGEDRPSSVVRRPPPALTPAPPRAIIPPTGHERGSP